MIQIEHFELATPRPVALALRAGCVIRTTGGRLWLTVQGQPDDVWLQAGECWTLPAPGTVWMSAEPTAAFQVAQAFNQWRRPQLPPWMHLNHRRVASAW